MGIIITAAQSYLTLALEETPVHLASDYIYPFKDAGGRPSRCCVRIYLPDDVLDAHVVVCSELPINPGS